MAPVPAVALELRHNLNYDGDRDDRYQFNCCWGQRRWNGSWHGEDRTGTPRFHSIGCRYLGRFPETSRLAGPALRDSRGPLRTAPREGGPHSKGERTGRRARGSRTLHAVRDHSRSLRVSIQWISTWSRVREPTQHGADPLSVPVVLWSRPEGRPSATPQTWTHHSGLSCLQDQAQNRPGRSLPGHWIRSWRFLTEPWSSHLPCSAALLWRRTEDVRAEVVAGDASGLLNRQHIFSRHPLPLANSLRGHTAHPSDMGGTTKRFEGDVLHG
ncbi:hypothetical protein SAMN05720615_1184 [Stenotrophomonas indicatrix]|nr:hypothetical protein SAMN05720615_109244 [Stenotrophomonas indicatrix]SEU12369.1 hypothetical protein SAMN05720615_1184 [Stenotrophomonas indicatrix]